MKNINFYDVIAPVYFDVYEDLKRLGHGEYWLGGGRGSGKSSFAALAILRGLIGDESANAVVYRRVANTLKDSVYAAFGWAAGRLGIERALRFRKSPLEIEYLPTGQRILFRGADDPLKSKSLALKKGRFKYLWFEETSEFRCESDLRSIVQSVLRGTDEGAMICTFNPPKSSRHWINELIARPKEGRYTLNTTYMDMPRAWLGERFISEAEALKERNYPAYRNEYLGEVTGTGGRIFENLIVGRLTDDRLNALDRRFFGLDFGFARDPDALTEWAYDRKSRELYAVREMVGTGLSPAALSEKARRFAGMNPVYCDSADPRLISFLRSQGVNAVAAKKGPGSREAGYRWLQTLNAIYADPLRTPETARELMSYEYPLDAAGSFVSVYPDGNDHTLDSCRYALEREISVRKAGTRADIY